MLRETTFGILKRKPKKITTGQGDKYRKTAAIADVNFINKQSISGFIESFTVSTSCIPYCQRVTLARTRG